MARHRAGDSAVADYAAAIRYRLWFGVGRRRWERVAPAAVEEQEGRVQWQRPNDLRVDILGRRSRSRMADVEISSVFDRPWFVPRTVGDSVRIFSDEFPATGALHPLAADAPARYTYRRVDAVTVSPPGREPIRLVRIAVVPREVGPALVAGHLWIDSTSAEVVRFTFRYVGTALWATPNADHDSTSARRVNAIVNRILSIDVDLEYALQDGRYWMPFRQVVSGRVRIPLISDLVIPFEATTTFDDYAINTGQTIAFEVPLPDSLTADSAREVRRDSLRAERRGQEPDSARTWNYAGRWAGGRFELHRPPNYSLARYDGWTDSLILGGDPADEARIRDAQADLAALAEDLPHDLTGLRRSGFGYEQTGDALQFNRVQGWSIGAGWFARMGPRFTTAYATARYGLGDGRIMGRLSVVRDAPGGRIALAGYRDLGDVDPFALHRSVGNSFNAVFAAHDNGDYYLAEGGRIGYETSLATGLEIAVSGRMERQRSVRRAAESGVNDFLGGSGLFPENPPIDEGTFGGLEVRLEGRGATRWTAAIEGLAGEGRTTARAFGELRLGVGSRTGATLRLKGGAATTPTLRQAEFRLGGINTVRGFDYGLRRGQAFWAAQLDVAPIPGRIRPVAFVDAGQAGRLSSMFESRVLLGAGAGVSFFNGFVRFDLSHPITSGVGGGLRFDLVFQAPR